MKLPLLLALMLPLPAAAGQLSDLLMAPGLFEDAGDGPLLTYAEARSAPEVAGLEPLDDGRLLLAMAEGLDAGAQDYIVKPFQLGELIARLEVQLRRAGPRLEPLRLGELTYDPAERRVTGAGRPVTLTEREGELLVHLMTHAGRLLARGEIFDALWAPHGGATENVVDVYLGYLRRKLDNFSGYGLALKTLRGRGFVLASEDTE